MRFHWLKKLPLLAILFGGLVAGILGKFLGVDVTGPLHDLNNWLSAHTELPGITLLFAGMLIGWAVYQVIVLWLFDRRRRARLALTDLRNEGVGLRLKGLELPSIDAVEPWIREINDWDKRVVAAIAVIDEPDLRQHETLDYPGKAREVPGATFLTDGHTHNYVMHDVRLVKLNERMTQYSTQTSH